MPGIHPQLGGKYDFLADSAELRMFFIGGDGRR